MIAALFNPDITAKFWFSKSTGKLEVGKQVHWEWEMEMGRFRRSR